MDKEQRQQENALTVVKGSHLKTSIYDDDVENANITNSRWIPDAGLEDFDVLSNTAQLTCLQWQSTDTIDGMKYLVLSHLQHSMQSDDDENLNQIYRNHMDKSTRLCENSSDSYNGITENPSSSIINDIAS